MFPASNIVCDLILPWSGFWKGSRLPDLKQHLAKRTRRRGPFPFKMPEKHSTTAANEHANNSSTETTWHPHKQGKTQGNVCVATGKARENDRENTEKVLNYRGGNSGKNVKLQGKMKYSNTEQG